MNEKYKRNFIHAGALAKQVRIFGKSLIKKGASYNEVFQKINQKIKDLDAIPAFPPQMALNHVAAHFLLMPGEDLVFSDELVKLDIGICYQGAIGDCAVTIDLSGKYQPLIDAVEDALLSAEKSLRVGQPISEIGQIIDDRISSYGFQSIKNLAGHGLGFYKTHTLPLIPNYYDRSKGVIKRGMTFAIEPFATDGEGFVFETGQAAIYSCSKKNATNASINNELFEKIKLFNGLPFSIHELIDEKFTLQEVNKELSDLLKRKILEEYPPLIEEAEGMVAQAENSILIDKDGEVFITTR